MKNYPNVRTVDYVSLVQSGIMTLEQVPADIQSEVARWLSFFAGTDNKEVDTNEEH